MSAQILDGTAVAAQIRSELSTRAAAFTLRAGRQPGLSIVLVGDKPDSQIYVNSKLKSAGDEGMNATLSHLPASASLDEILSLVRTLNDEPTTDGILVQAPLPDSLGAGAMQAVFDAIEPSKDVDGVTPANVGRLVQNRADLIPCTPAGIMELLQRSNIEVAGKHAVVIGRSDIVGKAGVDAPPAPPRDRDGVSLANARPCSRRCGRRHSRSRDWSPGICAASVREAWSHGHRRRHQPGDGRECRERHISPGASTTGAVRAKGIGAGGRRTSGSRRRGWCHHACSRRRRPVDDRDAHGEYDQGGRAAPRGGQVMSGFSRTISTC